MSVSANWTYEKLRDAVEDAIIDGNVRGILQMGQMYNLSNLNDDDSLMSLLLESPNLANIKDILLAYFVYVQDWRSTRQQILRALPGSRSSRTVTLHFELLVLAASRDKKTLFETFLSLMRDDIPHSFPHFVQQIYNSTEPLASKSISQRIVELAPFPQRKEALKYAKKHDSETMILLPNYKFIYKEAFDLFVPADLRAITNRINLAPSLQKKQEEDPKILFEKLQYAIDTYTIFKEWDMSDLKLLRDVLLDAVEILHLPSLEDLNSARSADSLSDEICKLFALRVKKSTLTCKNRADLDSINQEPIEDMSPMLIFVHNALCFEVTQLHAWISTQAEPKNPLTKLSFEKRDINRLMNHLSYLLEIGSIINEVTKKTEVASQ